MGFFAVLNVLLGIAVIFVAYNVFEELKKTSLSRPLLVFGAAFVLMVAHEAIEAAGSLGMFMLEGDGTHSMPSMLIESVFVVVLFLGVMSFKAEFEKFEWVREVTKGDARIIGKK